MKRLMNSVVGIAFAFSLLTPWAAKAQNSAAAAPQDQTSLGDYARKVHKDTGDAQAKPKVFDNDNIPRDEKISIVGEQPAVGSPSTPDASATTSAPLAKDDKKDDKKDAAGAKPSSADEEQAKKQALWKQWQDKLGAQKGAIDLASRELDVTQREYQLRAAEMYADVGNRLRNSAEWDKQEADYKQKIADKQKAVEDAKQKLDDMKEDARKAGVPASMTD
ncbi:MAG: hypothetical protein WBX38_03235 [Candidatus Sulfotelmatobacter sp.]